MIGSVQQKTGDRLRGDQLANTFGVSTMPVREALRQVEERASSFSGFGWAPEDLQGIPVEPLRRLAGETEPAEARINDVHRRVQLARDFFFTFLEASEKRHLLVIPPRLWCLSLQHPRYFSSLPQIVPQRLESYRDFYRACEARDPCGVVGAILAAHDLGGSRPIPLVGEDETKKQKSALHDGIDGPNTKRRGFKWKKSRR
jgi:DNA-binding GntR family transcriptional regulator